MLGGVRAFAHASELMQLAEAQTLERAGLNLNSARAQLSSEHRGPRQNQVAGEDRNRVPPHVLCSRSATTHRSVIHDVVVIQGCKVRHLNDARRLDDLVRDALLTEQRRQHHQKRAHTLAAGLSEVTRRAVDDRIRIRDRVQKHLLDPSEGLENLRSELDIIRNITETLRQLDRRSKSLGLRIQVN
mgnify:CR=1 FL=1